MTSARSRFSALRFHVAHSVCAALATTVVRSVATELPILLAHSTTSVRFAGLDSLSTLAPSRYPVQLYIRGIHEALGSLFNIGTREDLGSLQVSGTETSRSARSFAPVGPRRLRLTRLIWCSPRARFVQRPSVRSMYSTHSRYPAPTLIPDSLQFCKTCRWFRFCSGLPIQFTQLRLTLCLAAQVSSYGSLLCCGAHRLRGSHVCNGTHQLLGSAPCLRYPPRLRLTHVLYETGHCPRFAHSAWHSLPSTARLSFFGTCPCLPVRLLGNGTLS